MEVARSTKDLLSVVQRHLSLQSVRGEELADVCDLAWEVDVLRDWNQTSRVVAIVKHADTEQRAIFLFVGSRISENMYMDVTAVELIGLDNSFQCVSETPVRLRLNGRRMSKSDHRRGHPRAHSVRHYGDGVVVQSIGQSAIGPGVQNASCDSDEPNEPVGVISVSSEGKSTRGLSRDQGLRMWTSILVFQTSKQAEQFRAATLRHASSNVGGNRSASNDHFEVGVDVVSLTSASSSSRERNDTWLDKYRTEIARGKRALRHPGAPNPSVLAIPGKRHPTPTNGSPPVPIQQHGKPANHSPTSSAASTSSFSSSTDSISSSPERPSMKQRGAATRPQSLSGIHPGSMNDISQSASSPTSRAAPPRPPLAPNIRTLRAQPSRPSTIRHAYSTVSLERSDDTDGSSMESALQVSQRQSPIEPNDARLLNTKGLPISQSCTNFQESQANLRRSLQRQKSKNYMEDHLFRSRLSAAEVLVRQKMMDRVDDYSTIESVRIFIGTWNVNGRQESALSLDDWLLPPGNEAPADIYVFGFQELDLSIGSVALNKALDSLELRWTAQLESALGGLLKSPPPTPLSTLERERMAQVEQRPTFAQRWKKHTGGGYHRIRLIRLAGILLVVYLSARLFRRSKPDELATQLVATGVFNVMGNKGGVGLRLTLFNTSLCFINCHLAAGGANLERRNQDFQEIKRKMVFERRTQTDNPMSVETLKIQDHDLVFVCGDLNYRVSGMDSQVVRNFVSRKDYDRLLDSDELIKQRHSYRTFGGFHESPITFAPTYKFDVNTNTYDTSEKNRVPSYCDRILWSGNLCEAMIYRSHESFTMSDHKPVSAFFRVGLRRVDRSKFQHVYETVVRSQDLVYNLSLPQAKLDTHELDFGPVGFYEVLNKSLTLTNTGLDSLVFDFLRESVVEIPAWLTLTSETKQVQKDSSVEIQAEMFIQQDMAAQLNSGATSLSTIVVLRLQGGKDYFVSITGQFIPTFFGLPLDVLLRLGLTPVAHVAPKELQEMIRSSRFSQWQEGEPSVLTSNGSDGGGYPFHIPKELFRLTDFISEHLDEPELFSQMGEHGHVSIIRDLLDTTPTTVAFPDTVSVHSAVFCLVMFLQMLPGGVIPVKFQPLCLDAANNYGTSIKALASLPIDHQNLFCYYVAFLRRALTQSAKNGTNIALLYWTGLVSIRSGYYAGGIFSVKIHIPVDFPSKRLPQIYLPQGFYHPYVDPDSGQLSLSSTFTQWDPLRNHLWQVLHHIRAQLTTPTACLREHSAAQLQLLTRSTVYTDDTESNATSYANPEAADAIVNRKHLFEARARHCVKTLSAWCANPAAADGLGINGWRDEEFLTLARQKLKTDASASTTSLSPEGGDYGLMQGYSWIDPDSLTIFSASDSTSPSNSEATTDPL